MHTSLLSHFFQLILEPMPIFIHLLQLFLGQLYFFNVLVIVLFQDFGTFLRLCVLFTKLTELNI